MVTAPLLPRAAGAGVGVSAGAAGGVCAGARVGVGARADSGSGTDVLAELAASRSALTIRPPGPLPLSPFRSIPASLAIRRASGEALTRSAPLPALAGAAADGTASPIRAIRAP